MSAVDDYILESKEAHRMLLIVLNDYLAGLGDVKRSIKYGIPFYNRNKNICYLNPLKTGGVEMAFWAGVELASKYPSVQMKGRKMIGGITYNSINDIDFETLELILEEALRIDERYRKEKKLR